MCIADIFSTKMSGSCTFNYISSYSILKTLTSFISHCFACHQWQSQTELFAGCLPKCLLCARKFFSGLHPIYHFSIKKIIIRHALGKPPQESNVHAKSQPGRTKETCSFARQGERCQGAMVLSSSTTDKTLDLVSVSSMRVILWWHRGSSGTSALQLSPRLSQVRDSFLFSMKFSTQKGNSRFLPSGPTASYGMPTTMKECISWLGTDATMLFHSKKYFIPLIYLIYLFSIL